MSKNAWDYTLEIIALLTDIDHNNELLSKTNNIDKRSILSSKIDSLESKLFEIKDKLKKVTIS